MDIFAPLLEIGKIIYTPISNRVKHHRGLDENMKILEEKLEELNGRKTDIELQSRTEIHYGKKLKIEVEIWLQKVQKIYDDKHLEQEVMKGKFFSRARLGRLAAKKILEVEDLRQGGRFFDGLMVDQVPGGELLPTTPIIVGETTTEKTMEEIWTALISDDCQKIGLFGMGGSGKSTIMKHIHNRILKNNDRFDHVHWITVSKATSVKKLQADIARALNIKGIEGIKDEVILAGRIHQSLVRERRCVLIFDDMWEAFNLEDVGILEPTVVNGCKLIFTTRALDVCKRMSNLSIKMELLTKDEACNLFFDKVGGAISKTPNLKAIATQVVEECACLPLAIVSIGASMKGVVDEREWRNALKELRESTMGINEKVFKRLEYSYTRLKDENLQRCLLYCALYPQDYMIERQELISALIAEEIINGTGSREDKFNVGHIILNKLENACLLEIWFDGKNERVKMHDVIRDMALQIMEGKSMVKAGVQLRELPGEEEWNEDLETVSMMYNYIEEIHNDASPRCDKLKTLLLSNNSMLRVIPDSFFKYMPSLCVLDLSNTPIECLPNSISDLENLTSLRLKGCTYLSYVPSLEKLIRLRELDLVYTAISEVPEGMKMLVNLQYLNIFTERFMKFPTGILQNLIRLRYLILHPGSGHQSLKIRSREIWGLKKLERLECQFYELSDFNSYVGLLKREHRSLPNSYNVHVGQGHFFEHRQAAFKHEYESEDEGKLLKAVRVNNFRMQRLGEEDYSIVLLPNDVEQFEIHECDNVNSLWDVLVDSSRQLSHGNFSHLRELSIKASPTFKLLFTPELVPYFPNLKSIDVVKCEGMEELVAVDEEESNGLSFVTVTFPKLRTLRLINLAELKSIMWMSGILRCDSIERIEIYNCPKLKSLPLYLPLSSNGQPSPPPSLKKIYVDNELWDSLEWDNPIAKDVLQPFVQ